MASVPHTVTFHLPEDLHQKATAMHLDWTKLWQRVEPIVVHLLSAWLHFPIGIPVVPPSPVVNQPPTPTDSTAGT